MDELYNIAKEGLGPTVLIHSLLDKSGNLEAKILRSDCLLVLFYKNNIVEITRNLYFDILTVKIDFENKKISIEKYDFVKNVTTNNNFDLNIDFNNYSIKLLNIITIVNNFMSPNINDF
jgi:hypothetical protein